MGPHDAKDSGATLSVWQSTSTIGAAFAVTEIIQWPAGDPVLLRHSARDFVAAFALIPEVFLRDIGETLVLASIFR
jgi:hypothetical protein